MIFSIFLRKSKKTWFFVFLPRIPPHPPLPPLKGVPPPRRGVSGTVFRGFDPLYPPLPPLPPWIPPETQKNDENHDFCKKSWFSSFFAGDPRRIPRYLPFFYCPCGQRFPSNMIRGVPHKGKKYLIPHEIVIGIPSPDGITTQDEHVLLVVLVSMLFLFFVFIVTRKLVRCYINYMT